MVEVFFIGGMFFYSLMAPINNCFAFNYIYTDREH